MLVRAHAVDAQHGDRNREQKAKQHAYGLSHGRASGNVIDENDDDDDDSGEHARCTRGTSSAGRSWPSRRPRFSAQAGEKGGEKGLITSARRAPGTGRRNAHQVAQEGRERPPARAASATRRRRRRRWERDTRRTHRIGRKEIVRARLLRLPTKKVYASHCCRAARRQAMHTTATWSIRRSSRNNR